MFIDLNCFLRWAMWPMGLLFYYPIPVTWLNWNKIFCFELLIASQNWSGLEKMLLWKMFFYYQPSTILTLGTNSEAQSGRLWKKLGIYEIVIEPCACTCVINLEFTHIWFQGKKYGIIVLASLLSFDSKTRQTIFWMMAW